MNQRTTAEGKYDSIRDGSFNYGDPVVDIDFTGVIYPKYIQVISKVEPTYAEVTSNGEVEQIKVKDPNRPRNMLTATLRFDYGGPTSTSLLGQNFDYSQVSEFIINGESLPIPMDSGYYTVNDGIDYNIEVEFESLTDCNQMFNDCEATSLDISKLDTSDVTDMAEMFCWCEKLKSLDVSHLKTSKVTSMYAMLKGVGASTLDVSGFDTSNVTDMSDMFGYLPNVTTLDLSNFNLSKVTNMSMMFFNCKSLTSVTMMGDVSNVSNVHAMFNNITTNGTFYYNSAYDYSKIIAALPSTWTAVPL